MSETTQGTVKWFNNSKGYGFITPSDGGKDLFVHMSEIKMEGFKTLKDGQSVDFEVGSSEKGPCAVNVIPQYSNRLKQEGREFNSILVPFFLGNILNSPLIFQGAVCI